MPRCADAQVLLMPWCEQCAKYMAPSAMRPDGTCPTCGSDVETPALKAEEVADDERAPWHFKLLVVHDRHLPGVAVLPDPHLTGDRTTVARIGRRRTRAVAQFG